MDIKLLEEEPIVVVQFTCQQINCTRDSFGNVVDGQADEVHRWGAGGGCTPGWCVGHCELVRAWNTVKNAGMARGWGWGGHGGPR